VIAPARVRPFPWGAFEPMTRAEVVGLREVRGFARGHADLERLPGALAEIVGAPVQVLVRRATPVPVARGLEGGGGLVLARAEAPQLEQGVLVQVEAALIAHVVARVAQRKPPLALHPGASPSPGAIGAFGAVLVAALRRAHAGSAMRVVSAGPSTVLEADLVRRSGAVWAAALTVLVGDEAFEARACWSRSAALAAPAPAWDARALAALGPTPVALAIVAHAVHAAAAELATLQPGDAWMLEGWSLARGPSGELEGPVTLAAAAASTGVEAQLVGDGSLVLRGDVVTLGGAEAKMNDTDGAGLIEAVGEAPLTVRVEIGEASMAARDWAALGRGDVIALGRRVGEAVVLRVGGVPVARGELVELEGEVGVRIIERLATAGG
jgi:hypothetical protein